MKLHLKRVDDWLSALGPATVDWSGSASQDGNLGFFLPKQPPRFTPAKEKIMVVTKIALEIVVDDGAWQRNYGEFANLFDCAEDIQDTMTSVVAELIDDWLKSTGNEGAVRKIIRKG